MFISSSSSSHYFPNNFKTIFTMEGRFDVIGFKVMNQDFVKSDRFDGTNFTHWQDKMKFLCIALKIFYVLNPSLNSLFEPTPKDIDVVKA